MSKPEIDSDGFQFVASKKSSKKKTLVPRNDQNFQKHEIKIDIEKAHRRIQSAVDELEGSEYLKSVVKAVSNVINDIKVIEIVCFGLGHIGECNVSRYQLAFLLCLKNYFEPQKVLVHDPIFYTDECELIKKFNLTLIEENTEGSYIITNQGISIVYLPHCPKQLTNNFLWSNWGLNLENCILLGNSFTSIIDYNSDRILDETVPFIHRIHPYTHEVFIDNNFMYKDIFNDTSIHYFSKEKLESVPPDFWIDKSLRMATITGKPALVTLRQLLSELRKQSSTSKLAENQMARYILAQYRKFQTTDQQLCKAADEMHFKAKSYYDYLHFTRQYKEINTEFKGKGERSVEDTARMVGFKLPHDPK